MFIISSNINTRVPAVERLVRRFRDDSFRSGGGAAGELKDLAKQCRDAGADALEINIQQHFDRPEVMRALVNIIQDAVDCQLCLSTNDPEALEAGLKTSRRPPLVNYISIDEARLKDMLPLASKYHAGVVLLASEPEALSDARTMLGKAAVLVGAANNAGISNDSILIDPGLIHITSDPGQRHFVQVKEFIDSFPQVFDPPVMSTCWLGNVSTGAPRHLRPTIETTALAMLAGLGLSSVFMDVLNKQLAQALKLVRILNDELVYAEAEVAA